MISEKKLSQYIEVYRIVSKHRYPTFKEINNKLASLDLGELPERTFEKFKEELRDAGVKIKYNRSEGGYFIESSKYEYFEKIVELFQTANTIGFLAKNLIELIKMKEFVQLSGSTNRGKENMQQIMDACIKSRDIEFDYQKYGEEFSTKRRVQPYQIRESAGMWYLIGIEPVKIDVEPHKELMKFRAFGLDRIRNLKIGYKYKRDKVKEFKDHYADVIGIVNGYNYQAGTKMDVENIRLKVDKESWNLIEAMPWHHSQKKVEERGDSVEFELKIKPTSELERMILEWSPKIKVLEPYDLKKSIVKQLKEAIAMNE